MGIVLCSIDGKIVQARPGRLRRYWSRKRLDAIDHIRRCIALTSPKIDSWDAETRKLNESFLKALEGLRKKIGDSDGSDEPKALSNV
jgi:hypothetical protein